ncbi:hypothetical protein EBB59_06570 [Lysobacter pythonis]|uniref:Uncharacterized protein n=2 Tax=Solilutibacter pythonis TaxID=2483112 RepID=A0A3M2I228_9GAMM|nr:hypothetical protein EBB59_06570 [Lysobacter pythonis]
MLKDYPGHIERLQDVLDSMLAKPSHGVDPFNRAIWKLEGRLETFISEARAELKAAEASGDPVAIERAKAKELLMGRASSKGRWIGDDDLWRYFQPNQGAFE